MLDGSQFRGRVVVTAKLGGWSVGPVANVTSTNAAIGSYVLVLYFSGSQKKNDLWPFRCACKKKVVSILGIAI